MSEMKTIPLIDPKFLVDPNVSCENEPIHDYQTSLQKQLEHPFYKNADAFREEIKRETLEKAAKKYSEPFNANSWTIEQLAKHAMAENYDQCNYIYGMYERLQQQEKEIELRKAKEKEVLLVLEGALMVKPENKDKWIAWALEVLKE